MAFFSSASALGLSSDTLQRDALVVEHCDNLQLTFRTLPPWAMWSFLVAGFFACGGSGSSPAGAGNDAADVDASGSSSGDIGSSTDAANGPTADAGGDASGLQDASQTCSVAENDGGTCSSLDPVGLFVTATCSSAEPPQAQGGTIEDGTYVLEALTYYGLCSSRPNGANTTLSICGSHWDDAQFFQASSDAGETSVARLNFITTVQGTTVTFVLVCEANSGSTGVSPRGYTAIPGHLTFIYPDSSTPGATIVSAYTRQ